MSHFFILGLPRCRTLWFSEFFTMGDIKCWHEYLSIHEKRNLVDGVRGYADTNPLTAIDYKNQPVLIIERDIEDVIKSVYAAFDKPSFIDNWQNTITNYITLYKKTLDDLKPCHCLRVKYDDINNRLAEIWQFLLPDIPVNYTRISQYKSKIIKTKNRDLESSLMHTSNVIKDFPAKYDLLDVERITDYQLSQYLIQQCWDEISEDNAAPYTGDIMNEYWISFGKNQLLYGGYRLHQINRVTWQGHAFTLPRYRKKYALIGCKSTLKWLLDNTDCQKLIAHVPDTFINVQKFLEKVGFKIEGINRLSYSKNKQLWDIKQYGLTRKEIEEIL